MTNDWRTELRWWQREAFAQWLHWLSITSEKDFLAQVTPGGGKTIFALRCAHHMLSTGRVQFVVVVVPTAALKDQWSEAAHECGLNLQPDFANRDGNEAGGMHGVVATYAQVAAQPSIFAAFARRACFLIQDEPHHLGDGKSWGAAASRAFFHYVSRLHITGTAFRSDNKRIPFLNYLDGTCKADYNYGYEAALTDRIVRPVIFPHFDGETTWQSGGVMKMGTFGDDKLTADEHSEQLRLALRAADQELVQKMLREADQTLNTVRMTHRDAGGLIICMDVDHARSVSKQIAAIAGEQPVMVSCDDDNADRLIESFRAGCQKWIVAIKMVSEGVDIKRLRVGVFATNCLTELFFRQALGRILRMIEVDNQPAPEDQTAYFYLPAHPVLIEYARQVKKEIEHVLSEPIEERERKMRERQLTLFNFAALVGLSAWESGVIYETDNLDTRWLDGAREFVLATGCKIPVPEIASLGHHFLTHMGANVPSSSAASSIPKPSTSTPTGNGPRLDKLLAAMRSEVEFYVNRMADLSGQSRGYICTELGNYTDYNPKYRTASQEMLQKRIDLLRKWIKDFPNVGPIRPA